MVSLFKRQISLKITDILKNLSVLESNDKDLHLKVDYFNKVNRVDKSSKEFGTFSISIKELEKSIGSNSFNQEKFNDAQSALNQLSKCDLIESCHLENSKLFIKTNLNQFKKNTLGGIFSQKNVHGFQVDEQQLYPRLRNNDSLEWTSKKQSVNTVIEFSSPNIAKPLHAGHMRSTFLGNFLSKIHTNYGHSVTKINYLGDWGTQYGILAVGFKKYGSFDKLKESPIKHLLDVYVKANNDPLIKSDALEYFSQMEANDSESIQMWEQFKELSVKELDSVYKSLGISFNVFECESQYYVQSKAVVADLLEKGIANRLPNNAVEVELDAKKLKYILQKQDGTSLYISRDIAALLDRKRRYNFSKAVYVVDSSQRSHFVRLYETVKLLDKSSCDNMTFEEFYVPFGRLTNMSTRKGKVEFLAELILEAKHVALEGLASMKIKKNVQDYDSVAQSIGNSHLIISDLSRPRMKDYEFSWSNIVSKDDSAFMCHYSHARLFKYGS